MTVQLLPDIGRVYMTLSVRQRQQSDFEQRMLMQKHFAALTIVLFAWHRIDPGLADEKKRDKSDAFREKRQEGLPGSAVCPFLFFISFLPLLEGSQDGPPLLGAGRLAPGLSSDNVLVPGQVNG